MTMERVNTYTHPEALGLELLSFSERIAGRSLRAGGGDLMDRSVLAIYYSPDGKIYIDSNLFRIGVIPYDADIYLVASLEEFDALTDEYLTVTGILVECGDWHDSLTRDGRPMPRREFLTRIREWVTPRLGVKKQAVPPLDVYRARGRIIER